jgi:hypothetical protein
MSVVNLKGPHWQCLGQFCEELLASLERRLCQHFYGEIDHVGNEARLPLPDGLAVRPVEPDPPAITRACVTVQLS